VDQKKQVISSRKHVLTSRDNTIIKKIETGGPRASQDKVDPSSQLLCGATCERAPLTTEGGIIADGSRWQ